MRLEGLWSYFTVPVRINLWFPFEIATLEPELGGTITMTGDGRETAGTIDAYDAPQLFSFTADGEHFRFETHPEPVGTLIVVRHLNQPANPPDWTAALDKLTQAVS